VTGRSEQMEVGAFLARVARRRRAVGALLGAGVGLAVALVVVLAAWYRYGAADTTLVRAAAGAAAAGALAGVGAALLRLRRGPSAAVLVERAAPRARNVVITAAELLEAERQRRPTRVSAYVEAAVHASAAHVLRGLEPRLVVSAGRALAAVLVVALAWAVTVGLMLSRPAALPVAVPTITGAAEIVGIDVTITSPAYVGGEPRTVRDPERIEALAGSRLSVRVRAAADVVMLETVTGRRPLERVSAGVFTAEVPADGDGFLAVEPARADGQAGPRRMHRADACTPDSVPRVRITTPAGDVRLPDGNRSIDIAIEADDDIGLASLRLSYTKVTGFGEQFTFLDGEVPIEIERAGPRRWTARTRWPLAGLALERGDIVVYRAMAIGPAAGRAAGRVGDVRHRAGIGQATRSSAGGARRRRAGSVRAEPADDRRADRADARRPRHAADGGAVRRRSRSAWPRRSGRSAPGSSSCSAACSRTTTRTQGADETGLMELHEEAHARAIDAGRVGGPAREPGSRSTWRARSRR
jgi:hypothetical protein